MQDIRFTNVLVACLAVLPALTNAFWRLPCRGQTGFARLDPLVDPGEISSHVHSIHGGGNFGMNANMQTLQESNCTSCAVLQDNSAYWTPALYFMHTNGSAQLVPEVGGMLAYYLLYGGNVTAFPRNFRMLAGDPFQRNFTWPIPDPPKSSWTGAQVSQAALRQKAIGFNCLNYEQPAEGSLYRHYLPDKDYLDAHCINGTRLELMFPSCWNGKDVDSPDHKSHVAYPSLVMDGTCPEGYEKRLVSLFYETIWDTYSFKGVDGYFVLANGDPTGFGYHGDFMFGWDDGVLQEAVDTCTSESGIVEDCKIFDIQSEDDQRQCFFDLPSQIQHENVYMHADGLPGGMVIEWGPAYAMSSGMTSANSTFSKTPTTTLPTTTLLPDIPTLALPSLSLSLSLDTENLMGKVNLLHNGDGSGTTTAFSTTSTTSSSIQTSTTSDVVKPMVEMVIYMEEDVVVMINAQGVPYSTYTSPPRTMSSTMRTVSETSTAVSYVERDIVLAEPETLGTKAEHVRRHVHHQYGHSHQKFDVA